VLEDTMRDPLQALVRELTIFMSTRDAPPGILVVEADAAIRDRICRELRRLGCTPGEARTPLEMIHRLESDRAGPVHVVVLGPTLARSGSGEVVRFLEEAYPDIRVLVVADHDSPLAHLEKAVRAGVEWLAQPRVQQPRDPRRADAAA
jgi:ActR/RegA family two-component response regulator